MRWARDNKTHRFRYCLYKSWVRNGTLSPSIYMMYIVAVGYDADAFRLKRICLSAIKCVFLVILGSVLKIVICNIERYQYDVCGL